MRRAMALAISTAAWVLLIQVASTAMAPPVIVELAPVDVTLGNDPTAIVVQDGALSSTTTTVEDFLPAPRNPRSTTAVAVTSSTTSTTTAETITVAPATTAVPTTTGPAPTTTAAPPPTTTAPPATTSTALPATTTTPTPSGSFSAGAESEFLSSINGLRSSVGLAAVSSNASLNNYARWWAQQMADSGNFSHSNIASLLGAWSVVGENIGYGPSVASIFAALVNSPGHYKNMVDARFTSVGVGVYIDSSGRLWTAHVFGG